MNELPLELIRFIVEGVPAEDLENLRLVNKTLAAAAAPRLFEVISVWIGTSHGVYPSYLTPNWGRIPRNKTY